MQGTGIQHRLTDLLDTANREGGFPTSLVSTEQGLLIASAGEELGEEATLAALTAMFDDVVARSRAHLGFDQVDEVSVRDPVLGRLVVRPLHHGGTERMFLVVRVPRGGRWRRVTNRLCRELGDTLNAWGALSAA